MTDITREHEDDWFSSGADAAHTAWLEEMGHVNEEAEPEWAEASWLIVDPEAPGGARELTQAESERCVRLVAATTPQPSEHEPPQDELDADEPEQ